MKSIILNFALVGATALLMTSCNTGSDNGEDLPIYGADSSRVGAVTSISTKPGTDSSTLYYKFAGSNENHATMVTKSKGDSLQIGGAIKITKRKQVIILRH
ncbi:MAG: hypothetical protein WCO65_01385 [bacterium]